MTDAEIEAIVFAAEPLSDRGHEALSDLARAFVSAHTAARGGLSLELGAQWGGTALMFCKLLEKLYPDASARPMLFTVDPYGYPPNADGGSHYLAMKRVLSAFENHSHWHMADQDFLKRCARMPYAVDRRVENITFALLSSGSDVKSIIDNVLSLVEPLQGFEPYRRQLAPMGVIAIDRVDADPETIPWLKRTFPADAMRLAPSNEWAVIYGVGVR